MNSIAEALRLLNITLVIGCFAGFTPAIVHARDNIDRLYLIGGVTILASLAIGSLVHLHAPFNPSAPIATLGQLIWAISAIKSRRRRREREGRRE